MSLAPRLPPPIRRRLPIAPLAPPGARDLPLAAESRAVDRAFRPIYAVWEVTLACDQACGHCGSRAGRARPDELTTAEALDLLAQMARLGVQEVTFIGGEAYMRPDWLELIAAARGHGMVVSITTGGRGLTPAMVEDARAAGLMAASVSIDGDEAAHDRQRGAGSYRAAMAAMAALHGAGVRLFCNTQINRISAPVLEHVLEAAAAAGARAWQIQLSVPAGRAADDPGFLLQPYDLLEIFPRLAAMKARCDALGVILFPGNNVGYFGPHETTLRGHHPRGHGGSCSAGLSTLGIESNGAIKGCPSLPTRAWTGGNVRDASLEAIWERSAPLRHMRDRAQDELWGYCRECYYADTCKGGCTWIATTTLGRPGNNPFCHHRALEMDRQGKRERVVPVSAAPGEPFDHGTFEIVVESSDATEPYPATMEPSCPTA
jgi:radical SAM protein with 4Fe4S-binding SPASM domain